MEEVEQNVVVTPKTMHTFLEFAVMLRRIHIRLIAEGYVINDEGILKSERLLELEKDNKSLRKSRCSRKN